MSGLEHLTPEQIEDIKLLYPKDSESTSDNSEKPSASDEDTTPVDNKDKVIQNAYEEDRELNPKTIESSFDSLTEGDIEILEEDIN